MWQTLSSQQLATHTDPFNTQLRTPLPTRSSSSCLALLTNGGLGFKWSFRKSSRRGTAICMQLSVWAAWKARNTAGRRKPLSGQQGSSNTILPIARLNLLRAVWGD